MDQETKREIMFNRMKEKKQEVKVVRRIVLIIVLILVIGGGIAGISIYNYVEKALQPVNPESEDTVDVEIPIGSNLDTIARVLEENGIIHDDRIFKYYVKFNNETNFQAGSYSLTQSMTLDEIIQSLKTGKVYREPVFKMTVPEGLTLDQIANVIDKNTAYSAEEFMQLVTDEAYIDELMLKFPDLLTEEIKGEQIRYDLEGYLFPATYAFYEEKPSLKSIVEEMLTATANNVSPYADILAEQEKSVHWLLTFASLLEEEATQTTDRQTIASVFYNRLDEGMPLQTDPTVLYALGEHKDRVLYEDLEVDHPYNTYVINGLPPGPIANAGKSSIEAALDPTDTNYLFFLADHEGNNHFAETYEEHLQNIATHRGE